MPTFRLLFLVLVLTVTSGYRFRCWVFCTDQTSTQHDYIEQRDRCRDYAQLKLDMAVRNAGSPVDATGRRTLLVHLFSECMNSNGWNVPSVPTPLAGEPTPDKAAPLPMDSNALTHAPRTASVNTAADKAATRSALTRKAECDFARYAASTSSISAARAQACDLECSQRLKAAPEAPRPAACPSDASPNLEKGRYRGE
jgi:hypothetical protein